MEILLAATFDIRGSFSPAGAGGFNTFGEIFTLIITILISLTGAASVFFIILAGIKFITSSGDPKQTAAGRSTITYAIIGLAVTALAFVILQIVQYFLGSSVQISS